MSIQRPRTTVILAMSADGKISDVSRSSPQFSSKADYNHLEKKVAESDAVLFGAATLSAGGTAMRVQKEDLIEARIQSGKPAQPIQMVCTRSGDLDSQMKFFSQPIPRWLVTTDQGAQKWQESSHFDRVVPISKPSHPDEMDWSKFLNLCSSEGIESIAVLGGGSLISSLLAQDGIDELWLTLCPILLGGKKAPTPVDGDGFTQDLAPRLSLVEYTPVGDELFLHYRVNPKS